jgi:membrane protease YdiL (CAAX protease family)
MINKKTKPQNPQKKGQKKDWQFLVVSLVQYAITLIALDFFLAQISLQGAGAALEKAVVLGILFFALPLATVVTIFGENPRKLLRGHFSLRSVLVAMAVLLGLIGLAVVFMVKFQGEKYLTASPWVTGSLGLFLFLELTLLPVIVFSQEFFFRGFLLGKLKATLGAPLAILAQALLFVGMEVFLSRGDLAQNGILWIFLGVILVLNLIFGVVAYWAKSFFYSGLIYWMYLFFIDLLVFYQLWSRKG